MAESQMEILAQSLWNRLICDQGVVKEAECDIGLDAQTPWLLTKALVIKSVVWHKTVVTDVADLDINLF